MQLGTRRDPALVLVLILLTCGLYYFYQNARKTPNFSYGDIKIF